MGASSSVLNSLCSNDSSPKSSIIENLPRPTNVKKLSAKNIQVHELARSSSFSDCWTPKSSTAFGGQSDISRSFDECEKVVRQRSSVKKRRVGFKIGEDILEEVQKDEEEEIERIIDGMKARGKWETASTNMSKDEIIYESKFKFFQTIKLIEKNARTKSC